MRSSLSRSAALIMVACILSCGIADAAEANLLRNAGFEDDLAPVWEKRAPESPQRSLTRTDEVARSGRCSLRLESKASGAARLRQGHDQSIRIEPGSQVELSAWVKSDLGPSGSAMLQRMLAGLRVVRSSLVAAGFQTGQTIPRADDEGMLLVLPQGAAGGDIEVLAEAPGGQPGLVRLTEGEGLIVAVDVLSLPEPVYSSVGGYYKYLFLANTLADHGPASSLQFAEGVADRSDLAAICRALFEAFSPEQEAVRQ